MGQEVKKCVYTHMEPNYASRCFPCWDHPAKKAKFRLIFTVEQDLEVLSNMVSSNCFKIYELNL